VTAAAISGTLVWLEARVGGVGDYLYDSQARYDDVAVYDGEGPEAGWVDLNCQLLSVSCDRGVSEGRGRAPSPQSGQLSARFYDPLRYVDPLLARYDLAPMTEVRLRSSAGTVWTGYADEWTYDALTQEGSMSATDAAKVLASYDTSRDLPAQRSGARAAALLSAVPDGPPSQVAGTGTTLAALTLTGDVWSQLAAVAESEGGLLFVAGDGTVTFRCRNAPVLVDEVTILSDCPDPEAQGRYDAFEFEVDDSALVNIISVDRVRGKDEPPQPITASSTASIARFGPSRVSLGTLQLATDSQLWEWTQLALALGAWPVAVPRRLTYRAWDQRGDTASLPAYLGLEIGDQVRVRLSSREPRTSWLMHVLAVEHDIQPDAWNVTLRLGLMEPTGTGVYDGPAEAAVYDESFYAYRPLVEV
jgi:hypothetical protein